PGGAPLPTNVQVDSRGWLHAASMHSTGLTFETSTDGGLSWQKLDVAFPTNDRLNTNTGGNVVDIRVNGTLGIAAVLTRTDDGNGKPGAAGDPEQDWAYKFDISTSTPKLLRRYAVGLGNSTSDTQYHPTYETQGHRYDFATVGILPDGRLVTSILDESTISGFPTTGIQIVAPALAFEQDSNFGNAAAVPETFNLPVLAGAGVTGAVLFTAARVRRRRTQRARRASAA
ncbi:MAG: hypothetical protein ABR498_03435, partial [Candidatus Dormibacteria bacterium]